jgi:hypothetical protein
MCSFTRVCIWFSLAGISLLLFVAPANAQCGPSTSAFFNIGLAPGNPFQAQKLTTVSGSPRLQGETVRHEPVLLARDGQGRIRSERVAGKFKHDTGTEAGTEAIEHLITICDPVAQTITTLDTLNKTAKIVHARDNSVRSAPNSQRSFCSTRIPFQNSPNTQTENLGHQIIEGVDAEGVRITIRPLFSPNGISPGDTIREVWCSDELAAIVLEKDENTKSGMKTSSALTKLERNEPDAALFQVPSDYAVSESVEEPGHHSHVEAFPQP